MADLKFCNRQEACPLVMGAVEAKVKLQATLNVERSEWEAKRAIMNKLFSAAVKLRAAQKRYFKSRGQRELVESRVIETDFDNLLEHIKFQAKNGSRPIQQPLPNR